MSASDQDNTEYTPPPPKLKGFARASNLTGLVSKDRTSATSVVAQVPTPAVAVPSTSAPAAPYRDADSLESASSAPVTAPAPVPAVRDAAPTTEQAVRRPAGSAPDLSVNMDDPAAMVVSPTVLSVPEPIMRRFERARRTADSNTELVLDALRAHLNDLPHLVAEARRPAAAATAGEPFPWRVSTRGRSTKVRRVQLPIRPLVGELHVIDTLVEWVQEQIGAGYRSLGGRATRSEVVVAALNAYLPADRRRSEPDQSRSSTTRRR